MRQVVAPSVASQVETGQLKPYTLPIAVFVEAPWHSPNNLTATHHARHDEQPTKQYKAVTKQGLRS